MNEVKTLYFAILNLLEKKKTFLYKYLGASVYDVILAFEKASGVKIPVEIADRRLGDIPATYAKGTLAEEELGWKAEKTLDQMCKFLT